MRNRRNHARRPVRRSRHDASAGGVLLIHGHRPHRHPVQRSQRIVLAARLVPRQPARQSRSPPPHLQPTRQNTLRPPCPAPCRPTSPATAPAPTPAPASSTDALLLPGASGRTIFTCSSASSAHSFASTNSAIVNPFSFGNQQQLRRTMKRIRHHSGRFALPSASANSLRLRHNKSAANGVENLLSQLRPCPYRMRQTAFRSDATPLLPRDTSGLFGTADRLLLQT